MTRDSCSETERAAAKCGGARIPMPRRPGGRLTVRRPQDTGLLGVERCEDRRLLAADGHMTADSGALGFEQIIAHHNGLLDGFDASNKTVTVTPIAKIPL